MPKGTPSYLKINPDGSVSAIFSGGVGIEIERDTSVANERSVYWYSPVDPTDVMSAIRPYAAAPVNFDPYGNAQLRLAIAPYDTPTDPASLKELVYKQNFDGGTGIGQHIFESDAGDFAVVVDGNDQRSSFPKNNGSLAVKRWIHRDQDILTIPGGGLAVGATITLTVTHGMVDGQGNSLQPSTVLGELSTSVGGRGLFYKGVTAYGAGSFIAQFFLAGGGAMAAGEQVFFNWTAIADNQNGEVA